MEHLWDVPFHNIPCSSSTIPVSVSKNNSRIDLMVILTHGGIDVTRENDRKPHFKCGVVSTTKYFHVFGLITCNAVDSKKNACGKKTDFNKREIGHSCRIFEITILMRVNKY